MQKLKLIFLSGILLLSSCARHDDPDTQKMIALLKQYKMNPSSLKRVLMTGSDTSCYDCSALKFCSISKDELKTNVRNYRDQVWTKTSNITGLVDGEYKDFVKYNTNPHNWSTANLDAQYVDMSIEDMKNYLCAIDHVAFAVRPNTIRAYFIRYDANTAPALPELSSIAEQPNPMEQNPPSTSPSPYIDKHSICFVPVVKKDNGQTAVNGEILDKVQVNTDSVSLIWDIGREGCHNETMDYNRHVTCPPFYGCYANTILTDLTP